jgi:hypothetical protein
MLRAHFDATEQALLATSRVPANSGHSLHKGTPRETFVRQFLLDHVGTQVGVGTGEVIDANSRPGDARNQIDIVIYKSSYPKLNLGGGVDCFLIESVIATIEVKSLLQKADLEQAMRAATNVKRLKKNVVQSFSTGYQPPGPMSFVVAYDGPAGMDTVQGWFASLGKSLGIEYPTLGGSRDARQATASPSVDGVFVLGRGCVHYDNMPISVVSDSLLAERPGIAQWVQIDCGTGGLLLLFLFLIQAVSGVSASWLNAIPYVSSTGFSGVKFVD